MPVETPNLPINPPHASTVAVNAFIYHTTCNGSLVYSCVCNPKTNHEVSPSLASEKKCHYWPPASKACPCWRNNNLHNLPTKGRCAGKEK
ncbi:Uncharacterized protein HZ326_13063 [Fusarium oxysporum f. sp. albedinis]|nr:Uncharacterized protein HZ326_13063 [Fusarium oxysporum f. sp. albedinis]